jgi:hypothetical protein
MVIRIRCLGDVEDYVLTLWKLADNIVIHYDSHAFLIGIYYI